ncbi:MAG: pilus assembly protein [Chloroflexi bacterium]|nr:MAG: pilus assembly protein [Chloroflexota bacterium]
MQLLTIISSWYHWQSFGRRARLNDGQGLVEYALLMIFVAVGLIALLVILGPGLTNIYQNIVEHL